MTLKTTPRLRIAYAFFLAYAPGAGCSDTPAASDAPCAAASCTQAGSASVATTPAAAMCGRKLPVALHELSAVELHDQLQTKGFTLINVHIPYAGEIDGTDANIAYTDITAIEARLASDHAAKVVLYCRSGAMSRKAADDLVARGYCDVYDLADGMEGWTAAGFTLVTK